MIKTDRFIIMYDFILDNNRRSMNDRFNNRTLRINKFEHNQKTVRVKIHG